MAREPTSTYRIQLNRQFDFDAAANLVPYLKELGIDHLYCSPYFQAAPGSTHGYDVVDHSRANEELGGALGHARMCAAIERNGMRQLLDIVPNHMAITGRENPWWWDVLQNGPSSLFAAFFDVDWEPPERRLHNMVLLPVLADQYGVLLAAGKLRIGRESGDFVIRVDDRIFPLGPRSLGFILAAAARIYPSDSLDYLADAFGELPSPASTDLGNITRRNRDRKLFAAMLTQLIHDDPAIADAIDRAIEQINADTAQLHQVLEAQNYRLSYWRMAARDLGYRRFFDIIVAGRSADGERAGIPGDSRADSQVGERGSPLRSAGWIIPTACAIRLGYLERLRAACPESGSSSRKFSQVPKRLRESWPIDGTTGYDFLNIVGRTLCRSRGR